MLIVVVFFPLFSAISVELKRIFFISVTQCTTCWLRHLSFFPSMIQYFDGKWKHITKQIFLLHLQDTQVSSCPVLQSCPAILQDRAFFKNLALPCSGAGRVALSCGHLWFHLYSILESQKVLF